MKSVFQTLGCRRISLHCSLFTYFFILFSTH